MRVTTGKLERRRIILSTYTVRKNREAGFFETPAGPGTGRTDGKCSSHYLDVVTHRHTVTSLKPKGLISSGVFQYQNVSERS